MTNKEIDQAKEMIGKAKDEVIADLTELQLALVGGGCGNEIFG